MAVIITNGTTTLNTASGFYRVEAHNLACMNATSLALTTTVYVNVTFANAGNCQGIVLNPITTSMTDRTLIAKLEQYQSVTSFDTGTEKVNKVAHGLSDSDIVSFTTTGALPTGITAGTQYYVINKSDNDFQISTSLGGSVVGLSGTPTGTWNVGVERATKTLTTSEIAGEGMFGTYKYRGSYFIPFIFTSPFAVDDTASKWRFRIAHGTGTGTWNLSTSDATNPFYASWCDTAATFTTNDTIIVKDELTVDKTDTLGAVLGTGDTVYGVSAVVCSNSQNPAIDDVSYLQWQNPPSAAYTLTVGGKILMAAYSGMRIGSENRTLSDVSISIANPGIVTYTAHGLTNGQAVVFSTTGALPIGITSGTRYFVVNKSDNTFEIEATVGGGSIETTGSQSGVHTCLHRLRIPIAEKATVTFTAPASGTATTGFFTPTGTAANVYGGFSSLFVYGEIPTYQYTTLASDANTAQTHLITTDNVDWVNGNTVVIGKQNVKGQGDTTIYTVSSVSGNDITLTGNVATNIRRAGGSVIKLDSHGVKIQNTSTVSTNSLFTAANLVFSGVDLYNQIFTTLGTTYYYYLNYLTLTNRSKTSFTDVTFWTNSNSCSYLLTDIVSPLGSLIQRCYGFRQNFATACVAYYTSTHKSGRMEIKDSRMICQYAGSISVAANIRLTIENCYFENGRASVYFHSLTGINGIFKNNHYWGNATVSTSGGAVIPGSCINPTEISGNYYDFNVCAIGFASTSACIKCIDSNSIFGSEYANTVDISWGAAGVMPDYIFKSNTGSLVFDETYLPDMVVGGRIGFSDFNDISENDMMVYTYGKTQRVSTPVHTAGGSSLRFEPLSSVETFDFTFDIPTGDIQNKTMAVAIWCKINSATYYSGTDYQMPRMSVVYDNTTEVYSEATAGTDWQLLSLTFSPLTTAGKITITLSGMTDATSTDRYFYWDDISVLYPAGYKLDLGGLDIWDNALPVLPPISTVMSAADIWAIATSSLTGAGTIGKFVADIDVPTASDNATAVWAEPFSTFTDPLSAGYQLNDIDLEVDEIQSLVRGIGSGTGATLNFGAIDDNTSGPIKGVTFVGTQIGIYTYSNTLAEDGLKHTIGDVGTGNAIDIVYEFNIGAGRNAAKATFKGYLDSSGDTITVQAYNGLSWDTRTTIAGQNGSVNISKDISLLAIHTGTGADAGKVFLRFVCTGQTNPTLYVDELLVAGVSVGMSAGYADGAVWVKATGTSGTTPFVNGTADNPCPWADALAVANTLGLSKFRILNGETVTLTDALNSKTVLGYHWHLELEEQDITRSYFEGAKVTGIGVVSSDSHAIFTDCEIGDGESTMTIGSSSFFKCGFNTPTSYKFTGTGGGNHEYVMTDCFSLVPGSGTPVFDFSSVISTTGINFRRWSGGSNTTLNSFCTETMEVVTGGGQTFVTGGAFVELRGICRSVSITLSASETVQIDAVCGPISISGTAIEAVVNIYGVTASITNTSTGSTVNNHAVSQTTIGSVASTAILSTPANKLLTDVNGKVTVITNEDKEGYEISGVKTTLDDLNDAPALTQRSEPPTVEQIRTELEGVGTMLTNIDTLVTNNIDMAISEIEIPTTIDIAGEILAIPDNKLVTDTSGFVTVATNNDKSGYSLTEAYDAAKEETNLDPVTEELEKVKNIVSDNQALILIK